MPIYEYACKSCGHAWEEIQRITEDPLTTCPDCGAPRAQRLISQTSFILKGSGWYVTDYGRGNGSKTGTGKPESESKSESKSKSETKTESKSESKD